MNLLHPPSTSVNPDVDLMTVGHFRSFQYNTIIPLVIDTLIEFLQRYDLNLQITSKKINKKLSYLGMYTSEVSEIRLITDDSQLYLKIYIPTLLDGDMFCLDGTWYVPTLYIIDYPITIKKNSVKIYGLINSVSIMLGHDYSTFTGTNIPLSYLFQLFNTSIDFDDLYKEFKLKRKLNHTQLSTNDIINYYNNRFGFDGTIDAIRKDFETMFFDSYTYKLYKTCYGITSFEEILMKIMVMIVNDENENFVNLDNKRLIFVELLFKPLLDKITSIAKQLRRNMSLSFIKIDHLAILKYFKRSKNPKNNIDGLSGNYVFDTVNLYNGILRHKASMVLPGIERAPNDVQQIHETHFGRICPISISSQKPGHVVSLVPNTKIDMFGRFT